jgi:hypothetical protein
MQENETPVDPTEVSDDELLDVAPMSYQDLLAFVCTSDAEPPRS